MSQPRLRKVFSYRDLLGHSLETHTEHWRGFAWQAGPVVVTYEDIRWGKVQVWASSKAEGQRVIGHAAAIAGIVLVKEGWSVHVAQNPRYGRTGTMVPRPLLNGAISVTMRPGSSGRPEVVAPGLDL